MIKQGKRWLGALLALCMVVGMLPATAAAAEPAGTVAKGEYMDAEGNMQSYEVEFDTPLPVTGGTLSTGNYYLPEDLILATDLKIVDDSVVKLDLAGHILRGTETDAVITVSDEASLGVYDSGANADNPTPTTHYYTEDENGVWFFDDSNTEGTSWPGGVITGAGNERSSIYLRGGDPVFSLFAGSICGAQSSLISDSARHSYSGVYGSGAFRMYDGAICGCGNNASAVYVSDFVITGGLIAHNGRGVSVGYHDGLPSALIMRGGEIRENYYSGVSCSGVAGENTITMYDGTISEHPGSSSQSTAAVQMYGGTFIMNGGSICNNNSAGVYLSSVIVNDIPYEPEFIMNGGEICNNTNSYSDGGGVSIGNSCKFTMNGGKISNNTAALRPGADSTAVVSGKGGAIYTNSSEVGFVMNGGEISNNVADNQGGAIYAYPGGVALSGACNIYGNTAEHGDDLYLAVDTQGGKSYILINGTLTSSEKTSVAISLPGIFTSGWSSQMGNADPADHFVSDMPGYVVKAVSVDGATEAALVAVHTSIFMANGVQVGTATFTEGDTTLTEPEVPTKAHYDGVWESYDLAAATGDITVNAVYTLNNDHTGFETSVVTPPTCTQGGYTTYTCSVCGNIRQGDETEALGHDYQLDPDKSVAATPGHDGYEYYACSRCGDAYQKPLIAPIVTHTATFQIGEEVIGQVVFEEGSSTLDEPAIPQRPNYVGQWAPYDLAVATTDITVQGHYTPVDPDAVADVGGGAEAEYNNGVVTIDLSAKAASRTIKVISQKTKPVDVVLVLDQSRSMAESLTQHGRQSKRDALVDCANSFVRSLYENAQASGADHRVALVGFAYSAYGGGNYQNTGLLTTESGKSVRYDRIKDSDLRAALLSVNDGGQLNANILAGISSIQAEGATAADLGLRTARDIFAANPNQDDRERIVIFITDGTPTAWGNDASLVRQTGAAAITVANTIKNGQGAKIYSVGVHADADPEAAFTSAKDGVTTDRRGNISYDFNRFLHAVSSNYPDAAAMSDLGTGDKNGGYYMGVRDTGNLGSIFTNILYSTVYELKTFDKATLSYTLSQEFTLTMEQELALRERLQRELGLAAADIQIDRNADGTTQLTFRNVKVREVYGADGALYYEALVRFEVSANDKTLAGGTVSTGAGDVSYEDAAVTTIQTSAVTIPSTRSMVAFTINGQVYCLRDVAPGEIITVPETELASWSVSEGTVAEAGYAVFEANSAQSQEYTIVWSIDGQDTVQRYPLGAVITPPEVPAKAGYDFTGWSRAVPYTMPAYDLVCEAIYSPAHVHSFEGAYQTGSCKTGLVTVSRCACGETKEETAAPGEHSFTAVLVDNGSSGTTLERVVCTKCGHSEEQNINFKVSYSSGWRTTVLDLNLLQNEINVTQPENEIEMRFFVGDNGGRRYTVTRIDANGHRTTYQTRSENGYLVFRADHFSVYVLSELDETTSQPIQEVKYEEAVGILDSKVDAKPTTPIEGTAQGGNTSSGSGVSARPQTEDTSVSTAIFSDVPEGSFYADAVAWAVKQGITNGTGEGKFSPDAVCTRSQMVTFLWRTAGEPEPSITACSFSDVSEDAEYYKAVLWALEQKITTGTAADTFSPLAPCDRGQMVTFLYRYAQSPDVFEAISFADVPEDAFYADAVIWATRQGITKGTSGTTFSPTADCTRAQMVTFLYRLRSN